MSAELDAKWLELVANGRAEWMSGMLVRARRTEPAYRIVGAWLVEETALKRGWNTDPSILPLRRTPVGLPDWDDPATIGCLLGQVRKRYGDPLMYLEPNGHEGWGLASPNGMVSHEYRVISASAEAGVCLRALECAP